MNKKNALIFTLTAFVFVSAAFALNYKEPQTAPPTPADLTATETTTPTPEPITAEIMPVSTTAEPLWNPDTHSNGYCEGECWEGICPFFTGYPEPPYTDRDIELLAKTVWGEARGCAPDEWRLVVWTVLQRVDADRWGDTIEAVITAKNQFVGYNDGHPIDAEIYALCAAELADWAQGREPPTHYLYAPTAPYYFFDGDGRHNWYREEWR